MKDLNFECSDYNRRSGFGHKCILYYNGIELCKSYAQYINRTWERYTYQKVQKNCVQKAIKLNKKNTELLTKLNLLYETL